MYIVAIAWIYVVLMMSITEQSVIAGVMTFLLYGVFPLVVILYLMGTPQRKRNRLKAEKSLRESAAANETASCQNEPNGKDSTRA
jgi:predicted DNA repair protein MutK